MKPRHLIFFLLLPGIALVLGFVTAPEYGGRFLSGLPLNPADRTGGSTPRLIFRENADDLQRKARIGRLRVATLRLGKSPASAGDKDAFLKSLAEWAALDPEAAMAWAETLSADRRQEAMRCVLTAWTHEDPQTAWNWASQEDPANAPFIDVVLTSLGKTDPSLAWDFAGKFAWEHPEVGEYAYTNALLGIVHSGKYEEMARMIGETPLPSSPDQLAGRPLLADALATQWAQYEPEKAAAWVATLPEGIARTQATIHVAQSWSEVDPEGAIGFSTGLPAGEPRKMAVTQALTSWMADDPEKASEWMNKHLADPDFDTAIYTVATSPDTRLSPELAIGWANSIVDRELRLQSLNTILTNWAQKDPAAAREHLKNASQLPPETRDRMLRELEKK